MKQLLCCIVNPHAKCRCGFTVCRECSDLNLSHRCKVKRPRKGYSWGTRTVYVGKPRELKEVIALVQKPCGRKWAFGGLSGTRMKGWVPRPTSHSAMFLKYIEIKGKVRRNAFYDSSMISNLSSNKAGYIRHIKGRYKGGYVLTPKGKKYLTTHDVKVDVAEWEAKHTALARYVYGG